MADIDECNLGYCPPFMICENYMGGYSCYPKKESKVFVIVFGMSSVSPFKVQAEAL
ncbi:hypothetical protein Patl1_07674 [Pistacia atlantica]|uniref:Uncharacterized protein n=1 Tax=Pistacia atlantica TaxID=434234 RepID=A0ACC1AJB6_9ROSI|nr:hypothetical protein Patl1_07674 [Pistacia atlantica]